MTEVEWPEGSGQRGLGTVILHVGGFGLAAFLVGAGGLGIEALCLSTAGLALGYGRPVALGLALWIAGWACGAYVSARWRTSNRRRLAWAGGLAGAAAVGGIQLILLAGDVRVPVGLASAIAVGAILSVGFCQGLFLPPLASAMAIQAPRVGIGWLVGTNLAGAVVGAQWIGHGAVANWGQLPATWIAAGASLLGGLCGVAFAGAHAAPGRAVVMSPKPPESRASVPGAFLTRGAAGWTVGCLTAHMVALEWIGLRYSTLWLGGMQTALTAVLVASFLALSLGAALLPLLLPRDGRALFPLLLLIVLATLWPFAAPAAMAAVDGLTSPVLRALVLVGPLLLPLGAWLPVVHRALAGESGERLGGLLLHEAWGALLGVGLAHYLTVPRWGLAGGLAASLVWCALAALVLGRRRGTGWWPVAVSLLGIGAAAWVATHREPPALSSPALANPAFSRVAFEEDEHFAVTVVDDGVRAERTLLTDSFRATAVGDDYLYMQVLGHLPLLLHPDPKRVAVLAFGTGTTAGAVSLHGRVERLDVLEISRAVCRMAPHFEEINHGVFAEGLPGLLDDTDGSRVVLKLGDGRRTLRAHPGTFDVITMEPLLPDSPFAVYLYTEEFYGVARAALRPGGMLCQWVPPHALGSRTFDAVIGAFTRSFPWSGVFLFGTQVVLLGADEVPALGSTHVDPPGGELSRALAALGLDEPSGLAARFVTSGSAWPQSSRRLRDRDPWIVYVAPVRGAARLLDLPLNLARMRRLEEDLPGEWGDRVGAEGRARLEAVRLLHRAREVRALERAARFGARPAVAGEATPEGGAGNEPALASLAAYRAALGREIPHDAERLQLERGLAYESAREAGLLALSQRSTHRAAARFLDAIDLRPDCADLYLFLAVALQGEGDDEHALASIERALELCPGILATPQGANALRLGLVLAPD